MMHLTPAEEARLTVAVAADLARRRLGRGARLGATEATALLVDEIHEWAWDGHTLEEVTRKAASLLSEDQVHPGVPRMLSKIQVDALFPSGTYLVNVLDPITRSDSLTSRPPAEQEERQHAINAGRPVRTVTVRNTSNLTVRVTSHANFAKVNPALEHREDVADWRLDIPAGSSERWLPNESRTVRLIPIAHPAR